MFQMRLKISQSSNEEWRCCLCLHVRTATILLGIWHLMLHVLALVVLALIMRNNHMIIQKREEFQQNDFLPTPLSKINDDDNPYYLPTTQDGRTIYSSDIDMGALMTVFTLSITLLMVYGVLKGKASHLLPFFCLQLFDFAITTFTATGYFCYLRSVHRLVAEHWHNLPFRNELLQLSPQYLSLIVLGTFIVSMIWKAYWIGVVWRCYKFLTLRQQTRNTVHYILPGETERLPEPDYSTLLRDQEASFAAAMKQTPPPSYQDIMDDQPPPYPVTVLSETIPPCYRLPTFTTQVESSRATETESNNAPTAEVTSATIEETAAEISSVETHNENNTNTASQPVETATNETNISGPNKVVTV